MEQLELLGIYTEKHEEGEQYYIGMSRFNPYFRFHEDYLINNEVELVFTNNLGNDFVIGLQESQYELLVKQFNNQKRIKELLNKRKELEEDIKNG